MKQKSPYPENAHPSHASRTGRGLTRTVGQTDKPSPAFDANAPDGFSSAEIWRRLPLSVALTLLLIGGLITIGALVALRAPDPVALTVPLSWGAVGLASLIGGVLAGRRCPDRPVAAALLCGGGVVLLLTVPGFFLGGNQPSAWLLRVCILPLHLVGALLSRPRPKPAAHHDRRGGGHHH